MDEQQKQQQGWWTQALESGIRSPYMGIFRFWSLGNFIYPNFPQ